MNGLLIAQHTAQDDRFVLVISDVVAVRLNEATGGNPVGAGFEREAIRVVSIRAQPQCQPHHGFRLGQLTTNLVVDALE
jgi:hypothetical protein